MADQTDDRDLHLQILEAIDEGEFPPGARLLETDLAARFGRPGLHLSQRAEQWMLHDYPWPGNLRQVRNVLERSLVLAEGDELDPEPPADAEEVRPRPLLEVEREEILRALAYTRGHQGNAADLLGISRKPLWEKRKRYGIP